MGEEKKELINKLVKVRFPAILPLLKNSFLSVLRRFFVSLVKNASIF